MTNKEKIEDYKKRAQNKSLPASAVAALNKMIAELEKEEPKKDKSDSASKDVWTKRKIERDKEGSTGEVLKNGKVVGKYEFDFDSNGYWVNSKTNKGQEFFDSPDEMFNYFEKEEPKKEDKKELNEYLKKYDISKGKTYSDGVKNHKLVDFELKDGEWFLIFDDKVKYSVNLSFSWKEVSKSEDKKETKSNDKETEEERCQKIIRDAKAASKKARESAKKSAKKPEVTKAKERIERTYEIIENKIEKGSLTKAEVAKLIVETKEVLKMLEKALKSL